MVKQSKIRIAVVGLGFGAEFVPIYLDHPDVQLVAICDSNPERLKKTTAKFNIKRCFNDVDDIIQSDEIDAVHLVSGIPDHARQAVAILKSGKRCACTVPMATTIADLKAIITASQETGWNYLMMKQPFTPGNSFIYRMIAGG